MEISVGVFAGNLSARVRDRLWERIQKSAKTGRATMVFNTNNEQGLDFRVYNSNWQPIDFDGLKLMMHPELTRLAEAKGGKVEASNASRYLAARQHSRLKKSEIMNQKEDSCVYTILDIETTGLNPESDSIISICALKFVSGALVSGEEVQEYQVLVHSVEQVPAPITRLTGISSEQLVRDGIDLNDAMTELEKFVGNSQIVAHNVRFDLMFINAARRKLSMPMLMNEVIDTLALSKKKLYNLKSYKLTSLAEHFGIDRSGLHNSAADCRITAEIYRRLTSDE
jgi:CRISPR-associated protein Cas2